MGPHEWMYTLVDSSVMKTSWVLYSGPQLTKLLSSSKPNAMNLAIWQDVCNMWSARSSEVFCKSPLILKVSNFYSRSAQDGWQWDYRRRGRP